MVRWINKSWSDRQATESQLDRQRKEDRQIARKQEGQTDSQAEDGRFKEGYKQKTDRPSEKSEGSSSTYWSSLVSHVFSRKLNWLKVPG